MKLFNTMVVSTFSYNSYNTFSNLVTRSFCHALQAHAASLEEVDVSRKQLCLDNKINILLTVLFKIDAK